MEVDFGFIFSYQVISLHKKFVQIENTSLVFEVLTSPLLTVSKAVRINNTESVLSLG